jgi:hypothetical protein
MATAGELTETAARMFLEMIEENLLSCPHCGGPVRDANCEDYTEDGEAFATEHGYYRLEDVSEFKWVCDIGKREECHYVTPVWKRPVMPPGYSKTGYE